MKCSECAEYKACSRKYDLRIRRRRCGKTDTAKYVVMEEGGGKTARKGEDHEHIKSKKTVVDRYIENEP